MKEKELKRLNRFQLLELLVMRTEENQKLRQTIDELNAKLQDRQLQIHNLGSLAEASLQLNGVFAAAQKAADDYVEAARQQAQQIIAEAKQMNGADHEE